VKKFWLIALMAFGMLSCSPSEEELLLAGMEKMDAEAWVEAGEYFDRILDKNPNHAQALNAKGVSLFQQKKYKEAIPVFTQAIETDSSSYKPWFNRANANLELGNFKESVGDYNMASGLDPAQTDIYYNRGLALLGMEAYEDALLDFDAALQVNPNQALVHFNKGKAQIGFNDPAGALQSLTNAVNLDGKNGAAYYLLGVTRMSALGEKEEGCVDLKMALSLGYTEAKSWLDEFCK
jgi:tetratricopeptide (TPR) repeat protein